MRRLPIIVSIAAAALALAFTSPARPKIEPAPMNAMSPVAAVKPTIKITNFKFEPNVLTVAVGSTVYWVNEGGRHTVEADDGSFKSDVLQQGGTFEHKFDKAGTFAYHCEFHGEKGGKDMAGKIVVRAR